MKRIEAYIHHIRVPEVVQVLADAGYRNLTLHDVKGMLRAITEAERDYSTEGGALVISEVQIALVVEDPEVHKVCRLIRSSARIGKAVSGYVYVSPIEQSLPIGGPQDPAAATDG